MHRLNKHSTPKLLITLIVLSSLVSTMVATLAPSKTSAISYNCPKGKVWSQNLHKCVDNSKYNCSASQVYDKVDGCVETLPSCPDGQVFASNSRTCVSNKSKCGFGQVYNTRTKKCQDPTPTQVGVDCQDNAVPGVSNPCGQSSSGGDKCGSSGDGQVVTAINFGCSGKGNAIADLTFAIIRFLSNGVGLVVVGSIVFAGIQYTVSRADPQATAAAQERIRSSIIALIIYIFAYAILNYVIPKGFLHQ